MNDYAESDLASLMALLEDEEPIRLLNDGGEDCIGDESMDSNRLLDDDVCALLDQDKANKVAEHSPSWPLNDFSAAIDEPHEVISVYSSSDDESESKHEDGNEETDCLTSIDDVVSFTVDHREQKRLCDRAAQRQRRQKQKQWDGIVEGGIGTIRAELGTLGALDTDAATNAHRAAAMSASGLRDEIQVRTNAVDALRSEIGAVHSGFSEFDERTQRLIGPQPSPAPILPPVSSRVTLLQPSLNAPIVNANACRDAILNAYDTALRLSPSPLQLPVDPTTGKPPIVNVCGSTNWRTELWATRSRLNWRAQRYMTATPLVSDSASVEHSWELLTTPDAQQRRYRTVERIQVLSKFGDRNVVLKRTITIALPGAADRFGRRPRTLRHIELLSVAFHFRVGDTYYVGITSFAASSLGDDAGSGDDISWVADECESWVFTPPSTTTASDGWDVRYVGYRDVPGVNPEHSGDDNQLPETLSQAAMDVVETLPSWEYHLN